ncbi:TRAP transporter small permease [Tepidamorphus sp. 3E244]|uniref:TRAP transporter small permease n=1 Tax=Tepidamorphus sp. 3E244 TaxID=3385498 RepID=UPI0038FCEAB7
MRWLLKAHDALTDASCWGATLAVAYLTLVTAWEVFGRYALQAPSDWAPDTASVSFAMITFLAAPTVTRNLDHARMSFVVDSLPAHVGVWTGRLVYLVAAATCLLCAWYGAHEAARQVSRGVKMIAVTPIPKWVVTIVIAYSLASMAAYFLRHLAATFTRPTAPADTTQTDSVQTNSVPQ